MKGTGRAQIDKLLFQTLAFPSLPFPKLKAVLMRRFVASSLMASSARLSLMGFLRPSLIHRFGKAPTARLLVRKYLVKPNKAFNGALSASKRLSKQDRFYEEVDHSHIMWWKDKMQLCKKPSTVQLIKRLDYSNLLGLDVNLRNGRLKEGTLNMELLQFKLRFPREVLLCRVGDFYEAIGFDACVLVEYAGLNPFGGLRSDSNPRAGCPVMNLRQTLDDLTRSGFSICIVEELQGPSQARSRKSRFVSGHAHPGSPYVFGLAGVDHDVEFPDPMPVIGISHSAKGYCMISVLEPMKTFSAEDGLTEEAVVTKLRTCRYHHLYLHTSLRHNLSGTFRWGEFGKGGLLWGECNGKPCEWFSGDPIEELLSQVRAIYGLDQELTFRNVTISSSKRPQPLYLGTATQIGVLPTEGVPSLLKVLLPADCVGLPALYLRDLLLSPPCFQIASSIQDACRLMSSVVSSIPDFTCIPSAKLVKLLESKEANHIELYRIKNVVDEVIHMSRNSELSGILHTLLEPTWLATGLKIEYDVMVNECICVSQKIGDILFLHDESGQEINSYEFVPAEFFEDMEFPWKGRVKRIHAEESYGQVDRAAEALSVAVMEDFFPIVTRVKSLVTPLGGPKGEICYAREHEAVWFKGKRFVPAVWANTNGEEQIRQLKPATDSKGRKVGDEWFTTSKVEDALNRYHEACDSARVKVLDLLRGLSSVLQSKLNILVFSSMLLVIAKALFSHVSEGRRREWVFPKIYELLEPKDQSSTEVCNKLDLTGLSPYWFDMAHGNATKNTVNMNSLFLLTGPNGGGKSSLLRSICAASLLGICGLMVPAESALIPHFDSIMLHMKAYDSPADGKSTFQIEMSEIRSIVNRSTGRSLVLIDEICRGTETVKGTCIAGSIIETLDSTGCLGIVSTHLHGIFDLPLARTHTVYKAMGTEVVDGYTKPTWKLIDGICRESLAFETAKREGIPENVIQRAQELYLSVIAQDSINHIAECSDPKPHFNCLAEVQALKDKLQCSSNSSNQLFVEKVKSAVMIICQSKLIETYKKKSPSDLAEVKCHSVGAREQPPPSTVGTSNIYVLIRPDKTLYIGQTDDLVGRLRTHRTKEDMQHALMIYMIVPGKSVASQLETFLINQLPLSGFRLVNHSDGRHRNFGIAGFTMDGLGSVNETTRHSQQQP
ncbi:DNA mismatch repair protein MSH1, mitochondrial-like isoform X2 [Zingiber officinale]|uniref:DNA mismatch repair protein MSH1, mitochondrial-like isoform X2 n=1 Tax=Zingiber officinale TaxID=94328 RepID=UPI001C4B82D4|nr:DNA mismatch repair protein MSH1, mitochondrial-like isoform X2 [Zingiber officinale]